MTLTEDEWREAVIQAGKAAEITVTANDMIYLVVLSFMLPLMGTEQVSEKSLRHTRTPRAVAPGNIIIGGLFPIHEAVERTSNLSKPQSPTCINFSTAGLTSSLVMIYAVEKINRSSALRRLGITLGYHIRDTCSDVTTALRATEDFMPDHWENKHPVNMSEGPQTPMAVIGAYHSEMSIAVARELNLELIPQVSYGSTAYILSDKDRFPAFFRTVPSDLHQTSAMVKLLSDNAWNWVGVVTTDGDYGRSALDNFVSQALKEGICISFKEILPDSLTETRKLQAAVNQAIHTIHTSPKVMVIVSFAKPEHMSRIFKGLLARSTDPRLWVASDSWSSSGDILSQEELNRIGWVVGFSFKSGDITPFQDYLSSLKLDNMAQNNNDFLQEYFSGLADYQNSNKTNISHPIDVLINKTQPAMIFSIELAVTAIAQAVVRMCSKMDCSFPAALQPCELLPELQNSTFQMDGTWYTFNDDGDINMGYDISLWTATGGRVKTFNIVAEYDTSNSTLTVRNLQMNLTSKCSDSCQPGQFKKSVEGQHTCCYDCTNCAENQYSNSTDMDQCYSCDSSIQWAPVGSSVCHLKQLEFFAWDDPFAMVLLSLAALGVVMVFLVSFLFVWNRNSPVVKAAGGPLCQLILFSLVGSFVSTIFFVGRPNDVQCKVRQVLYGLSFTLCVSCILVKSLKILLAFQMKLLLKRLLQRLYKPYIIISVCVLLQAMGCTSWLLLASPRQKATPLETTILEECNEGSNVAFGVMLGYIALLALACFVLAFQGRKLPEKYNEAKFITFGMLVYLMAWIIFIPTYVNTTGKYLPAVEMVVILISNYGILSCHFLPKCYAIIFKKADNTRDAFLNSVYEYSKKTTYKIKDFTRLDAQKNTEILHYSVTSLSHLVPEKTVMWFSPLPATENNYTTVAIQDQYRPSLKRTLSI